MIERGASVKISSLTESVSPRHRGSIETGFGFEWAQHSFPKRHQREKILIHGYYPRDLDVEMRSERS